MAGKKIFLVDDEADMTQLFGALLKFNGFDLASANDPQQALSRLADEDADTIIVDLMMPGLDGLTLITRLRETPRHKGTPIVALSAKILSDDDRKSLLRQKVRFVPKPVSPRQLVQIAKESVAK